MRNFGENHIVTIYNDKLYSYFYYARNIENLSKDFSELNIKNEPVLVIMDDSPTCITCFLSLINIGAKPLILSPKTITKTIMQIIDMSKARIIVTDQSTQIDKEKLNVDIFVINENSVLNKSSVNCQPYTINNEVCYLGLTSGSSGIPKIVMHSSEEMKSAVHFYAKNTLKITKSDTLFSIAKINFTYGLANSLFFSFATGARAVIYEGTLCTEQILQIVNNFGVTYLFAVPVVFERISKELNYGNTYFSHIKRFISAGDYLSPNITNNWFCKTGKYIFDSVGCSETGSAYLINIAPESKPGSAGIAVEGYTLTLIDGDDHQGSLVVEGPSNALGYLNDNENNASKFINGKVYTGDWFKLDDDGYYWFLGRRDDMVKKNGRWISLNELTSYVKKESGIENAVTFLSAGKIILIIEPTTDEYNTEQLLEILRKNLEHYKTPDIIKIGKIPINSNGKIDYKTLRSNNV